MNQLDDLYMEIILDHYKSPRNKANLDHLGDDVLHENPSCGDSVKLDLQLDGENRITQAQFDGHGCAISTASASLMTERLIGMNIAEAQDFLQLFLSVMRGEEEVEKLEAWGDLGVLEGVRKFPMRIKCATLAWHALESRLEALTS